MFKRATMLSMLATASLLLADTAINPNDAALQWKTTNMLQERLEHGMRLRVQSETESSGNCSIEVANSGMRYMQVHMGNFEDAVVRPSCINESNNSLLMHLYTGYNTIVAPAHAQKNFRCRIEAMKDAADKTGPWFDIKAISFSNEPFNAPIVTLADGGSVIKVGSKLNISIHSSVPVGGDVQVRFVAGPQFIRYRFNANEIITLQPQGGNRYTGTLTVDEDAISFFSGKANGSFISAVAVLNTTSCYFTLPYQIEVATKNKLEMRQEVGAIHVRDARDQWEKATNGENLAKGIRCQLIPEPDYNLTKGNDENDLTDGKLTQRMDDKLWFDSTCVGWYGGSGHDYIRLDLGKEQPLDKAVIRLLGGTNGNFKWPTYINMHISRDGKTYHTTASMQKLAPGESSQCDWKRYYYLQEGRVVPDTRVHAFELDINAAARYVIIEMQGETGAVFSDELALMKADGKRAGFNAAYKEAGHPLPLEGLIITPRVPELAIMAGLPAPQVLFITDLRQGRAKNKPQGEMVIEVPKGVRLLNNEEFKTEALPNGGSRFTYTIKEKLQIGKTIRSTVMFFDADENTSGKVAIYAMSDGVEQFKSVVPLKVVKAPEIEKFKRLHISLSWMSESLGRMWPDFHKNWGRLGFNVIGSFPRFWTSPKSVEQGMAYVEAAHKAGYKVIMNDSCFHEMVRHRQNPGNEVYCQIPGTPNTWLCPSYRGDAYKGEMERITRCVKYGKPDFVFYDIEIWGNARTSAPRCDRCRPLIEKSGKSLEEFLYERGTETQRDIKEAVRKGAEEAGIPMPVVASYNRQAAAPIYSIENWNYIYPKYWDMSQPSLYVCGRAQDVHDNIRANYKVLGTKNILPWLTAGTYGEFESYKIEQMVLEALMNGACGVTYFCESTFYDSPLDFYYHAKALEALRPYEDLVADGIPVDIEGDNQGLTYSMLRKGKECLLLVGNYRSAQPKTCVSLPFKPGRIYDIRNKKELQTAQRFTFEVPKNDVRLFHIVEK